jgi:hypothetical protein
MSYKPETQWIGGEYPGATPPHLHRAARKPRKQIQPTVGHKRRAIVEYVRTNGPCNAMEVSCAVGYPLDSVRGQLRVARIAGLLAKELWLHPNGNNRIAYYSGLQ